MPDLLADLITHLRRLTNATRFLVAYSGGMDSHVLLHALSQWCAQGDRTLRAVHVHHGLQAEADQWRTHCHTVCQALAVPFEAHAVDLTSALRRGDSVEQAARTARYAVFASVIEPDEVLLTAHHQEDQVETVLLHVLRGAGIKGLSAMPECRVSARYTLLRPFLSHAQSDLRDYAEQAGLRWIDDISNTDVRFARNFLRHRILPLLYERWPSAGRTVARSAQHCAAADVLLSEYAQEDLQRVQGSVAGSLSVAMLRGYTAERQAQIVRAWLMHHGAQHGTATLPSRRILMRILNDVIGSRYDAMPCVRWSTMAVRRYRDALYCQTHLPPSIAPDPCVWQDLSQPFTLPGTLGVLSCQPVRGTGIRVDCGAQLSVGFRAGGERLRLPHRQGYRRLKKLFQDWGIPPWERGHIPLLFCEDRLVAVVGYAIDPAFTAAPDASGYGVQWHSSPIR